MEFLYGIGVIFGAIWNDFGILDRNIGSIGRDLREKNEIKPASYFPQEFYPLLCCITFFTIHLSIKNKSRYIENIIEDQSIMCVLNSIRMGLKMSVVRDFFALHRNQIEFHCPIKETSTTIVNWKRKKKPSTWTQQVKMAKNICFSFWFFSETSERQPIIK